MLAMTRAAPGQNKQELHLGSHVGDTGRQQGDGSEWAAGEPEVWSSELSHCPQSSIPHGCQFLSQLPSFQSSSMLNLFHQMSRAKARNQKHNPDLLCRWQKFNYLLTLLLQRVYTITKLGSGNKTKDSNTGCGHSATRLSICLSTKS